MSDEPVDLTGDVGQEVLAVVDQHEARLAIESPPDVAGSVAPRPFGDADRVRQPFDEVAGVARREQVDVVDAAGHSASSDQATSTAMRVLPTPPGPTSVVVRCVRQAATTARTA